MEGRDGLGVGPCVAGFAELRFPISLVPVGLLRQFLAPK